MTAGTRSEMGLIMHLAPNLNKVIEMILAEIKPSASRCVIMQVLLSSSATDLIFSKRVLRLLEALYRTLRGLTRAGQ